MTNKRVYGLFVVDKTLHKSIPANISKVRLVHSGVCAPYPYLAEHTDIHIQFILWLTHEINDQTTGGNKAQGGYSDGTFYVLMGYTVAVMRSDSDPVTYYVFNSSKMSLPVLVINTEMSTNHC